MAISTKASKILIIVLVVGALALTTTTLAVITVNQNLSSSGSITTSPNIGVYSDTLCSQNMTTFNWGSVAAGTSDTQVIYVKNTGTGTITLSMSANNWTPSSASTYITVTWDKQNVQLPAGQSTTATLTLNVSSNISGITNFSNTIVITGTA
jgi:hypothetical protein